MRYAFTIGTLVLLALLCPSAPAQARTSGHAYVIAVGYNGVPAGHESGLQPLRFADDDALAFFEFASPAAMRAHLLTVFDAETQRRLGDTAWSAKPPSVAGLRAAVADVRQALDEDTRTGTPTTVYLYYSGHGTASEEGEPAFTLLDGLLTRQMLYDDVLAALPAGHVHLFVDSCHAEAIVRSRDAQAQVIPISSDDLTQYAMTTLARFPQVGAVLASTRDARAHEWETYQGGIFTHELLSGLRGAADINGDRRIEYSEIAAFLSAANREVRDPRAHIEAVSHPPSSDLRAAIVELGSWPGASVIEASSARLNAFFVEDDRGERIADVHVESRHPVRLVVPSGRTLYVRTAWGEATVHPAPGDRIALEAMTFREASMSPRGALEAALHRGLFATAYGPSYYSGFVDRSGDLVPVPLPNEDLRGLGGVAESSRRGAASNAALGWSVIGSASAMAVGAAVFAGMALQARADFDRAPVPGVEATAADRYARDTTVAAVFTGAALTAAAVGVYLLVRPGHDPRTLRQAGLNAAMLAVEF